MRRAELEHAIRAACDVAHDEEIWVFGSQAILGEFPDAPEQLRQSAEVDVCPKNFPERADRIDGALGELSRFHETFGFFLHGLSIEAATLPPGWQSRAILVEGRGRTPATGWCLEPHDLAASKLTAFRAKDREFARVLIVEEMISPTVLLERVDKLPVPEERKSQFRQWVEATVEALQD